MSSFLEIRDDEIDVEELMQKIYDNISKRKEDGTYDEDVISKLHNRATVYHSGEGTLDPQLDLEYILSNWDIRNETYSITSHRPITGKVLIKGRELVHGEIKRYVEPVNYLQSEFNEHVADFSTAIYQKFMDLEAENKTLRSELTVLRARFDRMSDMLSGSLKNKTDERPEKNFAGSQGKATIPGEAGQDPENRLRTAGTPAKDVLSTDVSAFDNDGGSGTSVNYFLFGEEMGKAWTKGGGPYVNKPNVFEDSKDLFSDCKNVLDIGCGTGTFLKVMKEAGIGAYGIDINEDYILLCESCGFNVINDDAVSHLVSLQPKSIDGVFISQLVEHLSSEELLEILRLCYEKMQYESQIVITTPNIRSMLVSSDLFYLDPTHISHVHPEVLSFMLKSCGYREIRERYYQPVADHVRLKRIEAVEKAHDRPGDMWSCITEIINSNTDKLNDLLFGFRDCCLIAKK
jgi:O-antigen chain-terminating methyltransferase